MGEQQPDTMTDLATVINRTQWWDQGADGTEDVPVSSLDIARAVLAWVEERYVPRADAVPRQEVVADLNRMADGRQHYRHTPDPQTRADFDAMSVDELVLWVEVCTWREAAKLAGGDREVLYGMPSWCWDAEMVAALHRSDVAGGAS